MRRAGKKVAEWTYSAAGTKLKIPVRFIDRSDTTNGKSVFSVDIEERLIHEEDGDLAVLRKRVFELLKTVAKEIDWKRKILVILACRGGSEDEDGSHNGLLNLSWSFYRCGMTNSRPVYCELRAAYRAYGGRQVEESWHEAREGSPVEDISAQYEWEKWEGFLLDDTPEYRRLLKRLADLCTAPYSVLHTVFSTHQEGKSLQQNTVKQLADFDKLFRVKEASPPLPKKKAKGVKQVATSSQLAKEP